tara:strand:- start:4902 stop:5864 length:963 start_codon:yes stop_codon:yes gene_type:complete
MTVIRSTAEVNFDATTRVQVNDTSLRLANMTTVQRDALTPADGDMIYNTTTNQFNIRINGAWTTLATVEGLVDSAPTTLDTLNELAAALGDDPNFATTVTNNLAGKLSLTGGTMSGDIDGNGNKVLFANVYNNIGDLPSATTYHGMFAHVHATGKGYFAHAGAWIEMANQTDLTATNTNVTNLTNSLATTNTNITNLTNNKLNLSGGTMTGTLTLSGAPSSANHAATKAYVDSAVAGAGGSGGVMNLSNTVPAGTYLAFHADPPNASWRVTNQTTGQIVASAGNFTHVAGPFTLSSAATLSLYSFGSNGTSGIIVLSVGN